MSAASLILKGLDMSERRCTSEKFGFPSLRTMYSPSRMHRALRLPVEFRQLGKDREHPLVALVAQLGSVLWVEIDDRPFAIQLQFVEEIGVVERFRIGADQHRLDVLLVEDIHYAPFFGLPRFGFAGGSACSMLALSASMRSMTLPCCSAAVATISWPAIFFAIRSRRRS